MICLYPLSTTRICMTWKILSTVYVSVPFMGEGLLTFDGSFGGVWKKDFHYCDSSSTNPIASSIHQKPSKRGSHWPLASHWISPR